MPSTSTIASIALGGATLLSIGFLLYFYYGRKRIQNVDKGNKGVTEDKQSTPKKVTENKPLVTIEDEDEDDEDEDDDEEEARERNLNASSVNKNTAKADNSLTEEEEEIKKKYDDASRLAQKFVQGQVWVKAAEKFSEAIDLSPNVASASKDILPLYNNRSAMYEKVGEFEKSLEDINIVLIMDPKHLKARNRRARIYEAQGKLNEAIDDYMVTVFLEQFKREPISNQFKIEQLCKVVASKEASKMMNKIRAGQETAEPSRGLPSSSYCKSFLDIFPSYQRWKQEFGSQSLLEELVIEGEDNGIAQEESKLEKLLNHVKTLFVNEKFSKAFKLVRGYPLPEGDGLSQMTDRMQSLMAFYYEVIGIEEHLCGRLNSAMKYYQQSMDRSITQSMEVQLKMASIHLELGDVEQAASIYQQLMDRVEASPESVPSGVIDSLPRLDLDTAETNVSTVQDTIDPNHSEDTLDMQSPIEGKELMNTTEEVIQKETPSKENKLKLNEKDKAWLLIHRSALWTTRDEEAKYRPNAVQLCVKDLDEVVTIADKYPKEEGMRYAKFSALIKSIHTVAQTKPQSGETITAEDSVINSEKMKIARQMYPNHESVLLLEADMCAQNNDYEAAMSCVDRAEKEAKAENAMTLMIKASVLTTKAFTLMSLGQMDPSKVYEAQDILKNVEKLYERALEIEPMAVEVMAQYAQLKSMIVGDFERAVALLKKAVKLCRSRDELQDVCALLLTNEAQANAYKVLEKM